MENKNTAVVSPLKRRRSDIESALDFFGMSSYYTFEDLEKFKKKKQLELHPDKNLDVDTSEKVIFFS
jgi:hypothetical protein